MLYFPQLSSGALAQYPLRRSQKKRTIWNDCIDGSDFRLADSGATTVEWRLPYSGLTQDEWQALVTLFQGTEGRLQTFAFFDPADNLLRYSGTLDNTVWVKDPLLQLVAAISDPFGQTDAWQLTNAGSASQVLSQTIEIPGSYVCCFSVYARSASPVQITMTRTDSDAGVSSLQEIGSDWRRLQLSGAVGGSATSGTCSISLPPGAVVDVYGLQVEAQPQPSDYKQTYANCGVYPATRFSEDSLTTTAVAVNNYAINLSLTSRSEA
jgi:hypothetical protein